MIQPEGENMGKPQDHVSPQYLRLRERPHFSLEREGRAPLAPLQQEGSKDPVIGASQRQANGRKSSGCKEADLAGTIRESPPQLEKGAENTVFQDAPVWSELWKSNSQGNCMAVDSHPDPPLDQFSETVYRCLELGLGHSSQSCSQLCRVGILTRAQGQCIQVTDGSDFKLFGEKPDLDIGKTEAMATGLRRD